MSTARLQRDRLTFYAYFLIAAHVWALYGMGPALLIMRDETGMSRTTASLHSTALAVGVVIAGLIGARLSARFGRGAVMQNGAIVIVVGVLAFAFGSTPAITITGALLMGIAGSLLINADNAFFANHHGALAPAAIGEANGLGMLAGLLSPLALGALVGLGLNWRLAVCIPIVILGIAHLVRGQRDGLDVQSAAEEHHLARLPRAYWWAWFVTFLAVATEFAFVLWAGDVLRDQAKVSTATAAAALSAVAIGMTLGRFSITALMRRFDMERVFIVSLVLPLVIWVPMWLSNSAMVILGAMFVMGIGLGFHFPLSMNRMLLAAPGLADEASNRSSLASGLAIGSSPFALALLADAVGLHIAFTMVPLLLVLAILATVTHPVRR